MCLIHIILKNTYQEVIYNHMYKSSWYILVIEFNTWCMMSSNRKQHY